MAHFLLQTGHGSLENEERFVEEELKRAKYIHNYQKIELDKLSSISESELIPVGTIEFVTRYLQMHHEFDKENPIEVPAYLRTDEFLKRDYVITTWDKIPKSGRFFLKDVSELKNFGQVVQADFFINDELFSYERKGKLDSTLVLSKDHCR